MPHSVSYFVTKLGNFGISGREILVSVSVHSSFNEVIGMLVI